MSNKNLINYHFESNKVYVMLVNNQPYFSLKNVCDILSISNRGNVKSRLDKKGIHTAEVLTRGGMQYADFINEKNLYKCIFKSKKQEAERFQDWVFSEVLPSIRKTGKYELDSKEDNNLLKHLNIEIQKQNVKVINAVKLQEGGVNSIKNYHNEICKQHTGMTATEIKQKAKECGKFKSNVYNSARQVIRAGNKPIAASMSVADQLAKANTNKSIEEICKIAKLSITLFKAIEESGIEHNFTELKE